MLSPLCHSFSKTKILISLGSPGSKPATEWLGLAGPSNQSYADRETIRWMKAKIKGCERHEHELAADSFIPERLLDVRGGRPRVVQRSDFVRPRKTRSNVEALVPKYSALSYCWGSDSEVQLKTTKESLPDRLIGIDNNEMTAVLRDAVHITKSLSINYLWVDALCILQDDISDWERQCVDMDKIYGNAHITLRADSSRSCCEGFLRQRGRGMTVPFQSRLHNIEGIFRIQFKYVKDKHRNYVINSDILYYDLDTSSLSNRGWVFQEVRLSTKVLLFGHANVHFLCENSHQTRGQETREESYYLMISERGLSMDKRILNVYWESIMSDYSKFTESSFTKSTDILPALSGMAALFCRKLQDDYLAGHWRKSLFQDLAWHHSPPSNPHKTDRFYGNQRENPFLVPSWSRLTRGYTEGQISYGDSFQTEVMEIDAQVQLAGENPFGAIRSGELIIRSNVLNITSLGELKIMPDQVTNNYYGLLSDDNFIGTFRLDFSIEGRQILNEMQAFKWVLLGSYEISKNAMEKKVSLDRGAYGLIICPAREANKFYRIGMFKAGLERIITPGDENRRFVTVGNLNLFKKLSKVETVTII
jgi:hypothetical protein